MYKKQYYQEDLSLLDIKVVVQLKVITLLTEKIIHTRNLPVLKYRSDTNLQKENSNMPVLILWKKIEILLNEGSCKRNYIKLNMMSSIWSLIQLNSLTPLLNTLPMKRNEMNFTLYKIKYIRLVLDFSDTISFNIYSPTRILY